MSGTDEVKKQPKHQRCKECKLRYRSGNKELHDKGPHHNKILRSKRS